MRILFVDHSKFLGGAEYCLLDLLTYLTGSNLVPILACSSGELSKAADNKNIRVHKLCFPKLRFNPLAPLALWRVSSKLLDIIRSERIDLIHSNTARASVYTAIAAKRSGIPLVWHVHDLFSQKIYPRLMCQMSSKVITVSDFIAAPLPCKEKICVIPNGVDPVQFSGKLDILRQELGLRNDIPLVGCAGRLRRWKGFHHFLESAALVLKELENAHFVIIGGRVFDKQFDYPNYLKKRTSELGIEKHVSFIGHRNDLPEILGSLDLLVHTAQKEPFGRILIEAMASRLPVVAFHDGASPEIIIENETGYLVPPGSSISMAEKIVELIRKPEMRKRMGNNGYYRVLRRFDLRKTSSEIVKIYSSLLPKD